MGKVSYLESLKRGNQTLTDKVDSLENKLLTEKKLTNELKRENYVLERKVKMLEEKIQKIEIENKRPTTLDDAIKNSYENLMNILGGK